MLINKNNLFIQLRILCVIKLPSFLSNGGTAIKEVLLDVTAANFVDDLAAVNGGKNSRADFLSQFVINFASVDGESTKWEPRNDVFTEDVTLAELVDGSYVSKVNTKYLVTDGSNRINLAPLTVADDKYRGIPKDPEDSDAVFIQITYKEDSTKNGKGEYVQNKFQGDKVDFFFNLKATQWDE